MDAKDFSLELELALLITRLARPFLFTAVMKHEISTTLRNTGLTYRFCCCSVPQAPYIMMISHDLIFLIFNEQRIPIYSSSSQLTLLINSEIKFISRMLAADGLREYLDFRS